MMNFIILAEISLLALYPIVFFHGLSSLLFSDIVKSGVRG